MREEDKRKEGRGNERSEKEKERRGEGHMV